jgi:hypothetical protein
MAPSTREALRALIERLKADGDGCCCHMGHEASPSYEGLPEIPAVPPSEHCCALRRMRTIEALEALAASDASAEQEEE